MLGAQTSLPASFAKGVFVVASRRGRLCSQHSSFKNLEVIQFFVKGGGSLLINYDVIAIVYPSVQT